MCILSVYTLLKVGGYFDLSVHVSEGLKQIGWGVGGWGELYPSFVLGFFEFFVTLQSP